MNNFRSGNKKAAKLTPEQVNDIRRRAASGRWTQRALGEEFDITVVQIGRIVRREVWRDLPPPQASSAEQALAMRRLLALQASLGEIPQTPKERFVGNLLDELGKEDDDAAN